MDKRFKPSKTFSGYYFLSYILTYSRPVHSYDQNTSFFSKQKTCSFAKSKRPPILNMSSGAPVGAYITKSTFENFANKTIDWFFRSSFNLRSQST